MLRSYLSSAEPFQGDTLTLDGAESQHLVKVRRVRAGEAVDALDGRGTVYHCRYREGTREAVLDIDDCEHFAEPEPHITLALAQTKGKTLDSIIPKAVELGAQAITVLLTENVEARLKPDELEKKRARWQLLAIEALKQSGNPYLLEFLPALKLEAFLEGSGAYSERYCAAIVEAAEPLSALAAQSQQAGKAVWVVGPEGDFTTEEYRQIMEAGFTPVSLGPIILKADTAALAGLFALRHARFNETKP